MKWLTEDLKNKLLENGRLKAECEKNGQPWDLAPLAYLRLPHSLNQWLLASLSPDDPDLAFGLCQREGADPELGYVRLSELEILRDSHGLGVCEEPSLKGPDPLTLSQYAEAAKHHKAISFRHTANDNGSEGTLVYWASRGADFTIMADPAGVEEGRKWREEEQRRVEAESAKLPPPRIRTRTEDDGRKFERVIDPGYRSRGERYARKSSEFEVFVRAGQEITIRRDGDEREQIFVLGDRAAYDSWNLIYDGVIVAITPKTVRIAKDDEERKARLNVYDFCRRNFGFNQREAYERNANVRD